MRKAKYSSPRNIKPRQTKSHSVPALEWLEDISGKTARTTSFGNRRLLVENHLGIASFSDSMVQLKTGCGLIRITGKDLSLTDVRSGALIVLGEIHQVQLPCEGRQNG